MGRYQSAIFAFGILVQFSPSIDDEKKERCYEIEDVQAIVKQYEHLRTLEVVKNENDDLATHALIYDEKYYIKSHCKGYPSSISIGESLLSTLFALDIGSRKDFNEMSEIFDEDAQWHDVFDVSH